jgi:CheY-like chemotaxis protein
MTRPCFLVIDREFAGSISTRKLVIETAKFNVITAYSGHEAVATLKRFPDMDGVVMDADIQDMSCPEMVQALKALHPGIPVIAICSPRQNKCEGADHVLDSFEPQKLLELLKRLRPGDTAAIEKRNEDLEDQGR